MGPFEEKFNEEAKKHFDQGMKNIHIDWDENFLRNSTKEKRCEQILKVFEEIDKWDTLSIEEQMKIQIKDAYENIKKALNLCTWSLDDFIKDPNNPERKKLMKIFGYLEISAMILGNWVR